MKTDGTLDTSFDTGITGERQSVDTVALQTNGKVVVGGAFEDLRGAPAEGILQLNPDGRRDPLFDSNGPGRAANIEALVRQPDGKLLVGYSGPSRNITKLNAAPLNGIGRLFVQAIGRNDFTLIQGIVMTIAVTFIFTNLVVDLLYAALDPRIRYR